MHGSQPKAQQVTIVLWVLCIVGMDVFVENLFVGVGGGGCFFVCEPDFLLSGGSSHICWKAKSIEAAQFLDSALILTLLYVPRELLPSSIESILPSGFRRSGPSRLLSRHHPAFVHFIKFMFLQRASNPHPPGIKASPKFLYSHRHVPSSPALPELRSPPTALPPIVLQSGGPSSLLCTCLTSTANGQDENVFEAGSSLNNSRSPTPPGNSAGLRVQIVTLITVWLNQQ